MCATDTISGITVPVSSTPIPAYATEFSIETQTIAHANQLTDSKIGTVSLNFNWKYSFDYGDTWEDAGTTSNVCYVILYYPAEPWSVDGYSGIPVYVEMMDYACSAMSGATDEFSAIQKLTTATAGFMIYNGSMHYTGEDYVDDFYVRDFVLLCNGSQGPNERNDCRDFSCVSDCLDAAVGIDWIHFAGMANEEGGTFVTKYIKAANISSGTTEWVYHEMSYTEKPSTWNMGDASLLLDSNEGDSGWTSPGIQVKYNMDWEDYEPKLTDATLDWVYLNSEWSACVLNEGPRPWAQ
ncbi:MAG TPA: hypothetical protein PLQ35_08510 [bacterium]|nr:hypothetical protein [bacterium]HQL62322.1 hypothetical protein [bacterium]